MDEEERKKQLKRVDFWLNRLEVVCVGAYAVATGDVWANIAKAVLGRKYLLVLPDDIMWIAAWTVWIILVWIAILAFKVRYLDE